MGSSKCSFRNLIYKPLTRYCYKAGKNFTAAFMTKYIRKYLLKYVKKCGKMEVGFTFKLGVDEKVAGKLVEALMNKDVDVTSPTCVDDLMQLVQTIIDNPKAFDKPYNKKLTERANSHFNYWRKGYNFEPRYAESDYDGSESELDSDAEDLDDSSASSTREETVRNISEYALGLYVVAAKNKGLDHGKAKEYWLQRGPRQAMTMVFYVAFSFAINEIWGDVKPVDRMKTLIIAGTAIVIAFFMLYHRLPDSIDAAVLRSCHDYYVDNKLSSLIHLKKRKHAGEKAKKKKGLLAGDDAV
jgi:hypothetical protein